jgi:uncharacterized protein (DUF362 family)
MNTSKVIIVRDSAVFQEDTIEQSVVNRLISTGITKLLETSDAESAWKTLFHPDDIVGLKVNGLAGRGASTHPEIAYGIVEGLKLAGIPEEHIIIWDKTNRDLKRSGFKINTGKLGVKCFGTDALRDGYESEPSIAGQVGSLFSTILSRHCTAMVNVPTLKDHDLSGVSISLKNFYGAIHNPNKYHQNNCNPYIADLNTHPYIKEKVKLTICDALVPQYHGGPSTKPQWTWKFGAILMSLDPVALDAVGTDILEEKRREHEMESLRDAGRPPDYIHTAAGYGLGIDDLSRIELVYC